MYFRDNRRWVGDSTLVWRRRSKHPYHLIPDYVPERLTRQEFEIHPQNQHLDIYTKRAALNASKSVVFLQSYSGDEEVSQCSGIVIESVDTYSIILTAASLLMKCSTSRIIKSNDIKVTVHISDGRLFDGQVVACDFHYNIAAIKIQSGITIPAASLTHLNDSITVYPSQHHVMEEMSFQLRPHSTSFDLIPGDLVIALGRSLKKPHFIMAAPGLFSLDRCNYECKELFMASCRISKCGVGGPLINCYGQVIGICLHNGASTAFMPITIASLWWEHFKKFGKTRRPLLGMELTNLYVAPPEVLEILSQKFHDVLEGGIFKGVIVEEVVPGSSADHAGIRRKDVIIQFGGKRIQSFLELFESTWNKVGESVELCVIRESGDGPLSRSMVVDEATSE